MNEDNNSTENNRFDSGVMLPTPKRSKDEEMNGGETKIVQELIENFDDFYKSRDLRKDLNPYQIFISKDFLKEILQEMETAEDERNSVCLRLGLRSKPKDGKVPIAWMLQTAQIEGLEHDQYTVVRSGPWYISDYPESTGGPQEPVVLKTPPNTRR